MLLRACPQEHDFRDMSRSPSCGSYAPELRAACSCDLRLSRETAKASALTSGRSQREHRLSRRTALRPAHRFAPTFLRWSSIASRSPTASASASSHWNIGPDRPYSLRSFHSHTA